LLPIRGGFNPHGLERTDLSGRGLPDPGSIVSARTIGRVLDTKKSCRAALRTGRGDETRSRGGEHDQRKPGPERDRGSVRKMRWPRYIGLRVSDRAEVVMGQAAPIHGRRRADADSADQEILQTPGHERRAPGRDGGPPWRQARTRSLPAGTG
jgi:hypothetical protein